MIVSAKALSFFAFPDEVRRIVYTTNAMEAFNSKLRRAVRAGGHFPSDDTATKLLYLILNRSRRRNQPVGAIIVVQPRVEEAFVVENAGIVRPFGQAGFEQRQFADLSPGRGYLDGKITLRFPKYHTSLFVEMQNINKAYSRSYVKGIGTSEVYYAGQRLFAGLQFKF